MGSGFIRCRCRPAGNLAQDFAIRKLGASQLSSARKVKFEVNAGARAAAVAPESNNDVQRFGGLDKNYHSSLEAEQLGGELYVPSTSPRSVIYKEQSLKSYGFI